jgi:hypothetical protein
VCSHPVATSRVLYLPQHFPTRNRFVSGSVEARFAVCKTSSSTDKTTPLKIVSIPQGKFSSIKQHLSFH